ncbi:DUF4826 family protein [Alteromonadaceae bacterium M269]|nr:DUF4826 family protein [Alteromonadaceae bacterium M269]
MATEQVHPNEPQNEEELSAWVRAQFQLANQYLAEHGVLFESVYAEDSRYLAPYFSLWKIKAMDGQIYWVLGGDMPSDHVNFEVSETAKGALRHFSLGWQLKAENIRSAESEDPERVTHADMLIKKAEMMYALYKDESIWGQQ